MDTPPLTVLDGKTANVHFMEDEGFHLEIPANTRVEQPLYYCWQIAKDRSARNTIKLGDYARAVFIEEYTSADKALSVNSETAITLGKGAELLYLSIHNFSPSVKARVISNATLYDNANLRWFAAHLGGAVVQSQRNVHLQGQGARAKDIEVIFGTNQQDFNISANLYHDVPHTKGDILVKNVLKDKAKTDFTGLIKIAKDAQQSDALLQEHSLLLSKDARSNALPSLEIEANDVRCTHSASTGQMDEEQIFYLMTRGVSREEARKTIVFGFLEPVMQELSVKGIREKIEDIIAQKWNLH